MRTLSFRPLLAGAALGVCSAAFAAPSVLICAAASSSLTAGQFTDPQAKLMATGRFSTVDLFNASTGTPTLSQLQAYDAVIVWSNVNFSSASALGDVLADYVDAGGGVVLAVFANSTATLNRYLTGRWQSGTYNIIPPAGGNTSGSSSLGATLDPGHPLMEAVSALSATTASRPTSTVINANCKKVATWADGKTLAATHFLQNRCDIGLYPPSSTVSASWWTGNGAELMANALMWAASNRVNPSTFNVTSGTFAGGTAASLANSDDDKVFLINDELASTGEVIVSGTSPSTSSGAIYPIVEVGASRNDLTVFVDAFNYATNAWEQQAVFVSALTDVRKWMKMANGADFIEDITGGMQLRIRWIPQSDLDAADGWGETIDEAGWVVNPA